MRLRKTFPRDVFFRDVLLPRWAHSLDVLAMSVIPDIPRDTANWFFRFGVCVGRIRRSPVYVIRKHCRRLLRSLLMCRSEVIRRIPICSTIRVSPAVVYREWVDSLRLMLRLINGHKNCSWYADSHPTDMFWPCSEDYMAKLRARGYAIDAKIG